jgi:malate synthase
LSARAERQKRLDAGENPGFLKKTKKIREVSTAERCTHHSRLHQGDWTGPSIPNDLQDRRVEITGMLSKKRGVSLAFASNSSTSRSGPVSAKMIINALNSGAKVFMADFEDSNAPTWANNIDGQVNLQDAVNGTLEWRSPDGKTYKLNPSVATLMVRPRGWHLVEAHLLVDGSPVSASLFDFGLYFFHNAHMLLKKVRWLFMKTKSALRPL